MEQTYLKAPKGEERRVRKKTSQNKVSYAFTSKRKITELKRVEEEKFILPPFIRVIKEVTEDGNYKNKALAKTLALSE